MFPRHPGLIADLGGDPCSAAFSFGCINHVSRRNDNAFVENSERFLREIDVSAQSTPDHLANLRFQSKMTNRQFQVCSGNLQVTFAELVAVGDGSSDQS